MVKPVTLVWQLSLSFLTFQIYASELVLTNQDSLQGEMVSVEAGVVTFDSAMFGRLTIDVTKVASFTSSQNWLLLGETKSCDFTLLTEAERMQGCAIADRLQEADAQLLALSNEATPPERRGEFSISGSQSRGNKVEANWEVSTGLEFRKDEFRHLIKLDYESKSQDRKAPDEEYRLRYSLDWFFKDRWFLFNNMEIGASEKKRIDELYSLSSGFGFQVWDEESKALSIESGVSYIREVFDESGNEGADFVASKELPSWRWAVEYRQQMPFSTELSYTQSVLYAFGEYKEWNFESQLALNVPIAAGLFTKFKMEYDYDSEPQLGKKKADIKSSIGIGYEW